MWIILVLIIVLFIALVINNFELSEEKVEKS